MASGRRGSRQRTIGQLIAEATGAEAGMVVNNCASALMLALAALAGSRGAACREVNWWKSAADSGYQTSCANLAPS